MRTSIKKLLTALLLLISMESFGSAGPSQITCINNSIMTEATGTGTWSALPGNPAACTIDDPTQSNTFIDGFSVVGTYGFKWGTAYGDTLYVTVVNQAIPKPVLTAIGPCQDTLRLTGVGANSIDWIEGQNFVSSGTDSIYVVAPGWPGPYYAYLVSSIGCVSPMSDTVNVTLIGALVSYIPNNLITVCSGSNVTFTAIPTNGGTSPSYQWSLNGSTVGTNSSTYTTSSISDGATLSVVMTSSIGCANPATASYRDTVQVFAAPSAPSISLLGSCLGSDSLVAVTSGIPVELDWYRNGILVPTPSDAGPQTVAGGNGAGSAADQFNGATGMWIDGSGYIYVADQLNNRVQRFPAGSTSLTNGVTVAGGNGSGTALDQLNGPVAIWVDGSGNIYVADADNYRVLKFPSGSTSATNGTVIAGGNGYGSATNQLAPYGIYGDASGNIYVSDGINYRVLKFPSGSTSATHGTIVAGDNGGGQATNQFDPGAICVDASSNLYICDGLNYRILEFPSGSTSATYGTYVAGNGAAGGALNQFGQGPNGVYINAAGYLYATDYDRVLRFPPGSTSTTNGTLVAGGNYTGVNAAFELTNAVGLSIDNSGDVYVVDAGNNRVQKWSVVDSFYTPTMAGSYTAVYYDDNGCSSPVSDTLVIGTCSPAGPNQTLCIGVDTLRMAATGTGAWAALSTNPSASATVIDSPSSPHTFITLSSQQFFHGVYGYVWSGTGFSDTMYVTIDSMPYPITSVGAPPVCSGMGDTFTVNLSSPNTTSTYQWYENNIPVGNSTSYYAPSITAADSVWVVVASTLGCVMYHIGSDTIPAAFTVINCAVDSAGPNQTTCQYSSIAMAATGSGVWSALFTNIAQATIDTPLYAHTHVSFAYDPAGIYGFIWTSTGLPDTTNVFSDTMYVIVDSFFIPSVTISAAQTSICSGQADTFYATPANGGSSPVYQWISAGVVLATTTSPIYITSSLVNGQSIKVAIISSLPCAPTDSVPSGEVQITVNNCASAAGPNQTTCQNAPITTAATGVGVWTALASNPGTAIIANPASAVTIISGFSTAGSYAFKWGTAAGDTLKVLVEAAPTPPTLTQTGTCLTGDTLRIGGTGSNGQIIWYLNGAAIDTTIGGGAEIPIDTAAGGNGSGSAANQLDFPEGLTLDGSGNLYVTEFNNNRVQNFPAGSTRASNAVTVAGTASNFGSAADLLWAPNDVCLDTAGNLYVADMTNSRIQKFPPGSTSATNAVTVAGGNGQGSASNQLNFPISVKVDAGGNVYVCDQTNNRVLKFPAGSTSATNGVVVAGGNGQGTAANQLWTPQYIFLDAANNLYVTDSNRIQKFPPNSTSATNGVTVAGGIGVGSAANQLNYPLGIFVDASGYLYVADADNFRVLKFPPGSTAGTDGVMVAGSYSHILNDSSVFSPQAVVVDQQGNIYVSELSTDVKKFGQGAATIFIPAGTGSYTASVAGTGGCDATSNTVTVSSCSQTISFDTICINGSLTVSATGTGTWIRDGGPAATIASPNSATTFISGFSVTGNYIFIWTGSPLDTVYVNVENCSSLQDTVWPGDADNNRLVDNNDLLTIGLGYDSMGPVRIVTGNVWQGDDATDWDNYFTIYAPTVNFNHADCNGDGTINAADTLAIIQNFGLTHAKNNGYINNWRNGIPGLTVKLTPDTVYAGDTLTTTFLLGDSTEPVGNIYGLAFTYHFDPIVTDTTSISFTYLASWLGTDTNSISILHDDMAAGTIQTAITGIDHLSRSGYGPIAVARCIITTDNINGKDFSYYTDKSYITDITAIDALGNPVPLNAGIDSAAVGYIPTGIKEASAMKVSIYPNPASTQVVVSAQAVMSSITITDMLGRQVLIQSIQNKPSETIDISALAAGIYSIHIFASGGDGVAKLIVNR
jgi:sugar lactone lactonase YvrE